MAKSLINLDRQATAKVFPFGDTGAGNEALVTINKGTTGPSTVVLDVKASQNIEGNLNVGTSALLTGILKSTTGTGALSIAVAGDFPTLNQNTSGSAATLTTGRTIGMTGDVVWTSASFNGSANVSGTSTIQNNAVTLAKMAQVATGTIFYRKTAGTGSPELQSLATLKTDLGLSGSNTGDQTITLTGDVTGSGTGSFTATLVAYDKPVTVSGTQNDVNKIFTIGTSIKSNSEKVYLNGQLLNPGSGNDYLFSGTTVTFQAAMPAPSASDVIRVYGVY